MSVSQTSNDEIAEKLACEIEATESSANDSIVAAAVVYLDQIETQEKPVEQDSGPDENKIKLCFDLKQHVFCAGGGVSMKKIMFLFGIFLFKLALLYDIANSSRNFFIKLS